MKSLPRQERFTLLGLRGELSLFGGSATRFTDWTLRRPVSAPVTHHDLNGVISWLIADAETPAFRGRLFGSLVGVAEAA
jgi:hypothetical protein